MVRQRASARAAASHATPERTGLTNPSKSLPSERLGSSTQQSKRPAGRPFRGTRLAAQSTARESTQEGLFYTTTLRPLPGFRRGLAPPYREYDLKVFERFFRSRLINQLLNAGIFDPVAYVRNNPWVWDEPWLELRNEIVSFVRAHPTEHIYRYLHRCGSQLNGNNGSWTNSDDVEFKEHKVSRSLPTTTPALARQASGGRVRSMSPPPPPPPPDAGCCPESPERPRAPVVRGVGDVTVDMDPWSRYFMTFDEDSSHYPEEVILAALHHDSRVVSISRSKLKSDGWEEMNARLEDGTTIFVTGVLNYSAEMWRPSCQATSGASLNGNNGSVTNTDDVKGQATQAAKPRKKPDAQPPGATVTPKTIEKMVRKMVLDVQKQQPHKALGQRKKGPGIGAAMGATIGGHYGGPLGSAIGGWAGGKAERLLSGVFDGNGDYRELMSGVEHTNADRVKHNELFKGPGPSVDGSFGVLAETTVAVHEYSTYFSASSSDQIFTFSVNPRNYNLTPQLAVQADNYNEYRIMGYAIKFTSSVPPGATTSSDVTFAQECNTDMPTPTNIYEFRRDGGALTFPAHTNGVFFVECKDAPWLKVIRDDTTEVSRLDYELTNVFMGLSGTSYSGVLGRLSVAAMVQFRGTHQIKLRSGQAHFPMTGVSSSAPFGTAFTTTSGYYVARGTLSYNPSGSIPVANIVKSSNTVTTIKFLTEGDLLELRCGYAGTAASCVVPTITWTNCTGYNTYASLTSSSYSYGFNATSGTCVFMSCVVYTGPSGGTATVTLGTGGVFPSSVTQADFTLSHLGNGWAQGMF